MARARRLTLSLNSWMHKLGWYIGWLGHDNLGDEAMWELCREQFPHVAWRAYDPDAARAKAVAAAPASAPQRAAGRRSGATVLRALRGELTSLTRSRRATRRYLDRARGTLAGQVAILGGGTIINHNYVDQYRALRARTGRPVPVFASGVGNVDFWTQKRPEWRDRRREWVEAFAELPVVGVRGPLSRDLLADAGATNVEAVADPALLLRPNAADGPKGHPSSDRRGGRVGINIGVTLGGATTMWGTPDEVTREVAATARRLLAGGRDVELFAVWPKDLAACHTVASLVADDRVRVAPVLVDASAFITYVREHYDAVLAFKLHAGVLAAAAGVPMVVLEYRPKCRDFALSIGWDDYCARTDVADADWMHERIEHLLSDLPAARSRLDAAVADARLRLTRYFSRVAPLLG